ncbi:DNA-binding protein WhiA [Neofamilia massiliensis]|uniref:DNA-binding protein WhiA n=1 Tax=Neofamilia massiliensis TaxID=1673724 RepID=UPI0006BB662E|nr:DNA-binding protein WhiA [Neofamilia massiliensis]
MGFSNDAKNEGARVHLESSKLILAELSAFVRTCCEIKIKSKNISLEFVTENASTARRIFTHLKGYSNQLEAYRKKSTSLVKNGQYIIVMNDKYAIDDLLHDTNFIYNGQYFNKGSYIMADRLKSDKEERAYLRGAFLGAGSITNPEKSYHLEIVCREEDFAEDLKNLINKRGLKARSSKRKNSHIVYIKEAEQISDFMALIGLSQSLLKFENIRVLKDLRNNVNRVVNCETANINKQIEAAQKQIADINYLKEIGKYQGLSDDIKEIAQIRLENEYYTLKEIAEKTKDHYTRSGVNYRLKKISKMAEKHRGAEDERDEG